MTNDPLREKQIGGTFMSNRNTWLFVAIAYGITSIGSVLLYASHLAKNQERSTLTTLYQINAILSPVNFVLALANLLLSQTREDAAELTVSHEE